MTDLRWSHRIQEESNKDRPLVNPRILQEGTEDRSPVISYFTRNSTFGEISFQPELDLRRVFVSSGARPPMIFRFTGNSTSSEVSFHSELDLRSVFVSPGTRPPVSFTFTRNSTSGEFLFHPELDLRRVFISPGTRPPENYVSPGKPNMSFSNKRNLFSTFRLNPR